MKADIKFILIISLVLNLSIVQAAVNSIVTYNHGLLSVKAHNIPLKSLFFSIAKVTGVKVYISEEIKDVPINVSLTNKSLELAFKTILKNFSYAVTYTKKNGKSWKILSLSIYPKNKKTNKFIVLMNNLKKKPFLTSISDAKHSGKVVSYRNNDSKKDIFRPIKLKIKNRRLIYDTDHIINNNVFLYLLAQAQESEIKNYNELMLFQQQVDDIKDLLKKEALSLSYIEKIKKIYLLKKQNFNKFEALKFIYKANIERRRKKDE